MTRFIVSGLLVVYPIDFSYIERMGYIELGAIVVLSLLTKVFMMALLLVAFFNPHKVFNDLPIVPFGRAIIVYVLLTTIMSYAYAKYTGMFVPFSIESRVVVQLLAFLSNVFAPIFVAYYFVHYPSYVIKWLFIGLLVMLFAVVGQIVWQGIGGVLESRLFGLAGEPKGLGLYLAPFFVAFLFSYGYKWRWIAALVLFAFIALTFSATAFLAIIVSSAGILVSQGLLRIRYLVSLVILVLIVMFVILGNEYLFHLLVERILLRFTDVDYHGVGVLAAVDFPLIGYVLVEGSEAPVFRLLIDYPILLITGLGYGMQTIFAYPYLLAGESGFLTADYEGYITPNLAALNNVTNYGFVISSIMLVSIYKSFKKVNIGVFGKQHRFLLLFFFSSFISNLLIYEIGFKVIFHYVLLSVFISYALSGKCTDGQTK